MNQDPDLVEEERRSRLAASAADRPRASGMDPGTRKLAIVAGSLGALLVLMVGGWSLLGHRPAGVPILAPPPGPIRVKPVDPGGMQLMGAQVAQTNAPNTQALAPGPEQAAPQALEAQVDAARKADQPPAPVPVPKPVDPEAGASTLPHAPVAPAPEASAPAAVSPPAPVPDQAPSPEARPVTGRHAVQLAALESDQAAHAEWTRLTRKAPALFGDRTPLVMPASRDGKPFFRLRTGGFASVAAATEFCGRAKAVGIACTLADF